MKGHYTLHSQTVQALTDKFCGNRLTAAQNRKAGNTNVCYPYRIKRFVTLPFKQMAIKYTPEGSLLLTLSRGIHFDTGITPTGKVHTAEIIWRGTHYDLLYTTDSKMAPYCKLRGNKAGIDVNEIHPVALCDENGDGLILSGREIRSLKQWRNKSLARLAKQLSRCKKGSRKYRRYLKARAVLRSKTSNQLRNLYHQATRKAIEYCKANDIVELVIGDPQGVEQNTRKKKRLNRKSAQKVSNFEYGRIISYLEYKGIESGLKVMKTEESYTTKACPVCGTTNSCTGRNYTCVSCGFKGHRDGKAGFMILRKIHPDLPTPLRFNMQHRQCIAKYRKRLIQPACVVGPDMPLEESSSCHLVKPDLCIAV